MNPMTRTSIALGIGFTGLILVGTATLRGQDARLQRGKYLVEEVARCQECHTPKAEGGALDRAKWLKGAKLDVAPMAPIQGWHAASPDLTSTSALWTRWGADGMTAFLETAKNPRGGKAGPPMPAYTLTHDDADAIVTYLKSLP
jgi:mono/diheme cytochrome c family protein